MKVGGSLAEDPASLRALCKELERLARKHGILMVPGGGRFADCVREIDYRLHLSDTVAHKMAILAMDQFGLLLTDILTNARTVYTLEGAKKLSEAGTLPILLPSRLMFQKDPLKHSWDITSDSIAACIAGLLHVKKLILVTDVDGVFTSDPKKDLNAKLRGKLSANELLSWNKRTCVDKFLPKMLLETRLDCYVVNGRHPERIQRILKGERGLYTQIMA